MLASSLLASCLLARSAVALSMPSGQPVSWVAAVIVAVGLIGLSVGTALRIRRRRSRVEAYAPPEPSTSSTEVSPRA